jgi:hypothetical protein
MIKIQLTNAENGIIKTVSDNQYNGVDQNVDITRVYELNEAEEEYFDKVAEILTDISKDLGFHLGGNFDQFQLTFQVDWGIQYLPGVEEVNLKIKELQEEIRDLKKYKKEISE